MTPYITLGRSGLRVSRLALGAMTFGTDWGWGADEDTARQLFNAYADGGGNFVDTADAYTGGNSERWVGKFAAERKMRDRLVISTKFSYSAEPGDPNAGGNSRKNILRAVDGSLSRLGTDYIDLYLLHTWDRLTPVEEVVRTLNDLVSAGKVRYVGLSDVPAWYAAKAQTLAGARGYAPFSALQLEYSLAERAIEDEFIPFGLDSGLSVMVWSPLASGLLSGKYRPSQGDKGSNGEGRLATMKGTANPAFDKFTDKNWVIVAELEKVAGEVGHSMAQIAVNWVANRPGVGSVILGATKLTQLQDNLQALDFDLPDALRARLDAVSASAPRFPYTFFTPDMQAMLTGGSQIESKPPHYEQPIILNGVPAGTS